MAGIFVNYRRDDSSGWAVGMSRSLRDIFGPDQVFADIATLEAGTDYTQAIEQSLTTVDVLLAVIGPRWLTVTDRNGRRRLDDPDDLVRKEIAAALRRGIRVVPVLVGGAIMPSSDDLPDDLKALTRRHAHELSDSRWDYDLQRLVAVLEQQEGRPGLVHGMASRLRRMRLPRSRAAKYAMGALLLVLVAAAGIYGLSNFEILPGSRPLASLRLTFLTDKAELVRPLASYLEQQGAVPSFVSTNELAKLPSTKPDIVIVGSDTRGHWPRNDPHQLKAIFENYRLIGLGMAADELFRMLDLPLSGVMHSDEHAIAVEATQILNSPTAINANDGIIEFYGRKTSGDIVGLYDGAPRYCRIRGNSTLAKVQKSLADCPARQLHVHRIWRGDGPDH